MKSYESIPDFSTIVHPLEEETSHSNSMPRHERPATRRQRILRRVAKVALGTTLVTGTLGGVVRYDIEQGKEAVADSKPSISHIYEPTQPQYDNAATVVLTGLGTRSAVASTEVLQAHAETGHVFALEYSNRDIDIDELTTTVIEGLQRQADVDSTPFEYISFDGYSMGGIVLLAVAAHVHEKHPELTVTSVSLNSTPVGDDGLTQKSSEAIETLAKAIRVCHSYIKVCDGIEYSRNAQKIIEIINRRARYYDSETYQFNFEAFKQTIDAVDQKLSAANAPSPVLIYNQASVIQGASDSLLRGAQESFMVTHGVEESIRELTESSPDDPPVAFFYTMSHNPSDDTVVDVKASAQALQIIAEKYDASLEVVELEVGHANVRTKPAEYNAFIAEKVNPSISLAIAEDETTKLPLLLAVDDTRQDRR